MFLEISKPSHEVTYLEILWADEKNLVQRTTDHYQPQTIYVQDTEIEASKRIKCNFVFKNNT